MDFDTQVKVHVYDTVAETTKTPTSDETAKALGTRVEEVEAAFARLYQKRLLVPEPRRPSAIRMAPPFSGIPTPFAVRAKGKVHFANCAWDALGMPAALHSDAVVDASDGHTGEPMRLHVRDGKPVPEPCVIHIAVPAARWVARHHLYVRDHAPLPVGRDGRSMVRIARHSTPTARHAPSVVVPRRHLVRESAHGRLEASRPR
jgi:Alkylmercury lyase